MIYIIVILVICCFIFYKLYKLLYFIDMDNTLLFTGAPGTGKTNEMVSCGLKLWRKLCRIVRFKNWIYKKLHRNWKKEDLKVKPLLYSNIPIRIGRYSRLEFKLLCEKLYAGGLTPDFVKHKVSRDKFCVPLKIEHLLEQESQVPLSVTCCTELGKIASTYQWENENIQLHLDDYVSMYRQNTLGGFFLADDQSASRICTVLRSRIGTCINMIHFHKWWKIYWVKMRNISISEDIKVIEQNSTEDNMRTRVGLFPLFHRNYDTYAFSERYLTVPVGNDYVFLGYKTNEILEIPKTEKIKYQGQVSVTGVLPTKINKKNAVNICRE